MSAEPESTRHVMGREKGGHSEGRTVKLELQDDTHGGTVEGYITGNLAADGELREVFLAGFGKEGTMFDGWTQFAAILLSLGLQAGVDFRALMNRVGQMRFEPKGATNDPDVPWAPSVPAYIVVKLGLVHGDVLTRASAREVIASWDAS